MNELTKNATLGETFEERFDRIGSKIDRVKSEIEESFQRINELYRDNPCTETPDDIIDYIDSKYEAWLLSERPAQQESKSDSPNLTVDVQHQAVAQHQVAVAQQQMQQQMQAHQQANEIMLQQQMLLQQQMNNL